MAKKFVRGVTGVDDIDKLDKSLTNVNDLVSDGQNTYVHTKKGNTESYYNLTDSVKNVTSSDSGLITVTKDDTTNTTTINPKHDAQKEQSLESTRGTVLIQKGENGTTTTTKVDTNPQKVLEHSNLLVDYGIRKNTTGNTTKLSLEFTKVSDGFDLNTFSNGRVLGTNFVNPPKDKTWFFVTSYSQDTVAYQEAVAIFENNIKYVRTRNSSAWSSWREQVGDKSVIDALLAKKQQTIITNNSIGVYNDSTLRQLHNPGNEYNVTGGYMKIILTYTNPSTDIYLNKTHFKFIVKINKNVNTVTFNLDSNDKTRFTSIFNNYGSDNTVIISGLVLSLTGSTLTVSSPTTSDKNQVITFSDII